MRHDDPAEHFGVVLDRLTGKVRRVFNPDHEWEFAHHHIDSAIEYMRFERKQDWDIPLIPNGMTLQMVWVIQQTFERGQNYRPGDE